MIDRGFCPYLNLTCYNRLMTKFEIAEKYMAKRYPSVPYAMREGNGCVWISMGLVEMYLTIRNETVVDVQVD